MGMVALGGAGKHRLCLGDIWNPWSSLALGEFPQKPFILQAGGPEKRRHLPKATQVTRTPALGGLPQSMALYTAPP